MNHNISNVEKILAHAVDYTNTSIELLKLQSIDKVSGFFSSLISRIVLVVFGIFFTMILNIGIALWIGDILGKSYYGFFIVALFYAIVIFLIYIFRHRWIKNPLVNYFINQILNK